MLCAESAVKVRGKIQVFLPPLQDVLEWGFMGLARNLAYVIDLPDDRPVFAVLPTGFTIDTGGGRSTSCLSRGRVEWTSTTTKF